MTDVEMFRSDEGDLRVFLTWKDGSKSQHAAQEAYTRCPQKVSRPRTQSLRVEALGRQADMEHRYFTFTSHASALRRLKSTK